MRYLCRFYRRKTRARLGIESPSQSTATVPASISQASSRNSSVTDISDSHVDISQHSLPAVVMPAEYPRGNYEFSTLRNLRSTVGLGGLKKNCRI